MAEGPTAVHSHKRSNNILDSYIKTMPSHQNSIDIFEGEWSSLFPPPYQELKAGALGLFQDVRVAWAMERLGGVLGQTVLDLGPLEGGHAYMMEQEGAAYVTSIEANSRAFLKCLIAKEILRLERTQFWYGNFVPFLETTAERFDLIVASGVLYHMMEPVKLLKLMSEHTDRVYLWTHYFDAELMAQQPNFKARFPGRVTMQVGTATIDVFHHLYRGGLKEKTYCGGMEGSSRWLSREGILTCLREFGLGKIETSHEMPDHPNGPCFSIVATR